MLLLKKLTHIMVKLIDCCLFFSNGKGDLSLDRSIEAVNGFNFLFPFENGNNSKTVFLSGF